MHARLSLIAQRTGDLATAARHATEAHAAGFDSPALRRRMAALALRTHAWRAAQRHAVAAIGLRARQTIHNLRVATEDLALAVRR